MNIAYDFYTVLESPLCITCYSLATIVILDFFARSAGKSISVPCT